MQIGPFGSSSYMIQYTDAELHVLGTIVAQWANLEQLVRVNAIMSSEYYKIPLQEGWNGIGFSRVRKAWRRVVNEATEMPEEHKNAFTFIYDKICAAEQQREFLMHRSAYRWHENPRTEIQLVTPWGGKPPSRQLTTTEGMEALAKELSHINGYLTEMNMYWGH